MCGQAQYDVGWHFLHKQENGRWNDLDHCQRPSSVTGDQLDWGHPAWTDDYFFLVTMETHLPIALRFIPVLQEILVACFFF